MIDATGFLRALRASPPRDGHRRHSVRVLGDRGTDFLLAVRQSVHDPFDFSVILTYVPLGGAPVNLRRHNGPTHRHRNPIEDTEFVAQFHTHMATERYQQRGFAAEHYAVPSSEFQDLGSALQAMFRAANFRPPAQTSFEVRA